MRRFAGLLGSVLACGALAQAGKLSDPEPAAVAVDAPPEPAPDPKDAALDALGGFDLELTASDASGLFFGRADAYENQATLVVSPSYAFGHRFFKDRFLEPLSFAGRLSLSSELSGNDPGFRGRSFAVRDAPELIEVARVTEGPARTAAELGDLTLSATHDKLAALPAGIVLGAVARLSLPTSRASWNATMIAASSLGAGLHRQLGPVELRWELRGTRYFFGKTVAPIAPLAGPVEVNGQPVEPEHFSSSGAPNPNWGLVHTLDVTVDVTQNTWVEARYMLFNTWAHGLPYCTVGVPGADVCRDGAELGRVQQGGAERDSTWFMLEAGWQFKPWAYVAASVSTYRPLRADAEGYPIANPFLSISAANYSTASVSLTVTAAAFAAARGN